MKKVMVLFMVMAVMFMANCTRVEPGYVGIKVNMAGSDRGVEGAPIVTGWVFYNPMTQQVYEFPTFIQTVVWTKDVNEGSPTDESITFNSKEGTSINADINLNYTFMPDKVPELFTAFRRSPQDITDGYLRSRVRDAFTSEASTMEVMGILGPQLSVLTKRVTERLNEEMSPKGIIIDSVSIIGKPRVDKKVESAINDTIEAIQRAIQQENKVREVKALAEQKREQAKGDADKAIEQARGEAESITMVAQAQAKANLIIAQSLTANLIEYQRIQKWDGTVPKVSGGGSIPMIKIE